MKSGDDSGFLNLGIHGGNQGRLRDEISQEHPEEAAVGPLQACAGRKSMMPLIMFAVVVRSKASIPMNANKRNTSQKDSRPIRWDIDCFVPALPSEEPSPNRSHNASKRNALKTRKKKNLDEPAGSHAERKERQQGQKFRQEVRNPKSGFSKRLEHGFLPQNTHGNLHR